MAMIVIEMTAQEAGVWRAQQRLIKQQAEMQKGYGLVGRSAARAGGQASKAFDTGKVLKYAAALAGGAGVTLSVAGSLQTVLGWANRAQQEIKGVAEALNQSYTGMKNIWQVSESINQYQGLSAQYKLAMAKEGIPRQQAQDLAFYLQSADQVGALPPIAQSSRFMDPAVAGKWFTTATAPMNWGAEAGTPEQLMSGLIAGAGRSKFATGETAEWAVRAAPQFAAQGVSPGEMLGIGAQMSWASANPETLATYMLALQRRLDEFATKGGMSAEDRGSLLTVFEKFRASGEYEEFKGQGDVRFQRALTAFERSIGQVRQDVQAVSQAFESGALFRQKTQERPPELTLHQEREVAAMQREVMLEPLARQQIKLETAIDRVQALSAAAGKPVTLEVGWEKAMERGATLGQVEKATQIANQRTVDLMRKEFPEVYEERLKGLFTKEVLQSSYGGDYAAGVAVVSKDVVPPGLSAEHQQRLLGATEVVIEKQIFRDLPVIPQPAPGQVNPEQRAQPIQAPRAIGVPPIPADQLDEIRRVVQAAPTDRRSVPVNLDTTTGPGRVPAVSPPELHPQPAPGQVNVEHRGQPIQAPRAIGVPPLPAALLDEIRQVVQAAPTDRRSVPVNLDTTTGPGRVPAAIPPEIDRRVPAPDLVDQMRRQTTSEFGHAPVTIPTREVPPRVPVIGGDGATAGPRLVSPTARTRPAEFGRGLGPRLDEAPPAINVEVALADSTNLRRTAESMDKAAARLDSAADRLEELERRRSEVHPRPDRLGRAPARPVKR